MAITTNQDSKLPLKIAIVVIIYFSAMFGGLWSIDHRRVSKYENQVRWYTAQECRPIRYIGSNHYPSRVYLCNDNVEYIWDDIPELKLASSTTTNNATHLAPKWSDRP